MDYCGAFHAKSLSRSGAVMATGKLYRPAGRDRHGDPVDDDGLVVRMGDDGTLIDQVSGLVFGGGPAWSLAGGRSDAVDTTGLIGVPVAEPIQPQAGDVLVVDGVRYAVSGPPSWSRANTLTGRPTRCRWWTITARA